MKPRSIPGKLTSWVALCAILTPYWVVMPKAVAAPTDIATTPIFASTTAANEVKPNVLFVLDDSGSMAWDYMPDTTNDFQGAYGGASSQCNGVYYNPRITYAPPIYADGTSYVNATFAAALRDGFNTGSSTANLSTSFKAHGGDTAQAAYYYVYSGRQTTERQKNYYDTNGIFYKECNSNFGSTAAIDGTNPVNSIFTKVIVSTTSGPSGADERTNFANWYSYYRTRILMMKTGAGQAFKNIDNHFRVGFVTLNNNASPAFLNVSDFDATQKSNFYSKLYGTTTGNSTPLREGLANAGRLYAGKLTTLYSATVVDPVQYACQQNYTILSTDGFWNGTDSAVKKIDGSTTMDNQDGVLPRPYNDGASTIVTSVTPYVSTQTRAQTTSASVTTKLWTRSITAYGADCSTTASTPPNQITTAPTSAKDSGNAGNNWSGSHKLAVGNSKNNPDNNRCQQLGGNVNNSNNNTWFCRGSSTNNPAVTSATATDPAGTTWYLVSSLTSNSNSASCISESAAFGNSYPDAVYACPGTAGQSRTYVISTPQQQTETITTSGSTRTDIYTGTQTTTQITSNGVAGAVGSLTPSSPTFALTNNISNATVGTASDVFTAWSNGVSASVCTPNSSLPTAGTSTAVLASSVISGGTTSTPSVLTSTGPTVGTPTNTTATTSGTSNTLADVAAYYYNTNLRASALNNCTGPVISPATTPTDLCKPNKVPTYGQDSATWQHMTTFTLGLGTRGRMVFSPTYLTDTAGDFFDIKNGSLTSQTTTCTWRDTLTTSTGRCNWPVPGADKPENIDDMWHAAVNGRGTYFSATDPVSLKTGLASSLNTIVDSPKPGTAAASATSNPQITTANNFQFSTYFLTQEWSGELIRQRINLTDLSVRTFNPSANIDGQILAGILDWSAQAHLDGQNYTTRNIYTKGSLGLIPFTWSSLGTAGLQSHFLTANISTSPPSYPSQLTGLSQFCSTGTTCLTSTAQTNSTIASGGAAGEALVNFLRGDRSNSELAEAADSWKGLSDPTKFYRYRKHVLGDIVSAQPQFVGAPSKNFSDLGYSDFKSAQVNRTEVVLAAANDGMLHAFNVSDGNEAWAYIPSLVLPKLYTLADKSYNTKHQYFVEGTPVVGDICPSAPCTSAQWKTIVVGGLNAGGTGFYALDITDTTSPRFLWEFTDANMGYTFGRPQIAKLDDGTWVVLVTSGYNNCPRSSSAGCPKNGTGDGQGYLYVLNAATGAQISSTPITTGVGGTSSPSGLGQTVAQVDSNAVIKRVYGGDLLGNVWRFTLGNAGYSAQLVATLTDSLGNPQPITERPQITTYRGAPVVLVGTGKYLGTSDVGVTSQQSFYGIKDTVTTIPITNMRSGGDFIRKTAVDGICPTGVATSICDPGTRVRTVVQTGGNSTDSLSTKSGWYLDFPANAGEISFTDSSLVNGILAFSTSAPKATTAEVCGDSTIGDPASFAYTLDFASGGAISSAGTSGVVGTFLGAANATGSLIKYSQSPNTTYITDPHTGQITSRTDVITIIVIEYRLSNGQIVARTLNDSTLTENTPGIGPTSRVSWRELLSD